jgi:hypothetical protein
VASETDPGTPHTSEPTPSETRPPHGATAQRVQRRFYGKIDLDPITPKRQFADLVDEVVPQITARPGVQVTIAVETQAESQAGFDAGVQRAVKETCNVRHVQNAEFEEGA